MFQLWQSKPILKGHRTKTGTTMYLSNPSNSNIMNFFPWPAFVHYALTLSEAFQGIAILHEAMPNF